MYNTPNNEKALFFALSRNYLFWVCIQKGEGKK